MKNLILFIYVFIVVSSFTYSQTVYEYDDDNDLSVTYLTKGYGANYSVKFLNGNPHRYIIFRMYNTTERIRYISSAIITLDDNTTIKCTQRASFNKGSYEIKLLVSDDDIKSFLVADGQRISNIQLSISDGHSNLKPKPRLRAIYKCIKVVEDYIRYDEQDSLYNITRLK